MTWVLVYVGSIVLVNWGFAHMPGWELFWSFMVGSVFITRDLVQRAIGHWCVLAMLAAGLISYAMASPAVAIASVAAFAVSESADWIVFTITRRPLRDRILYSTALSAPLDSAVFLSLVGILSPMLFSVQVAMKIAAAVAVWLPMRFAARPA